jgi:hypothetical protein
VNTKCYKDFKSFASLFKGINFDNIGLLIPWDTEFDRILNFGEPKYSEILNQTTPDIFEQYLWTNIEFLGIHFSTFGIGHTFDKVTKDLDSNIVNSYYGWIDNIAFDSINLIIGLDTELKSYASDNKIFLDSKITISSGLWTLRNIEISIFENERLQQFEFKIKKTKK